MTAPGDELIYVDRESFAGDRADLDEVPAILDRSRHCPKTRPTVAGHEPGTIL